MAKMDVNEIAHSAAERIMNMVIPTLGMTFQECINKQKPMKPLYRFTGDEWVHECPICKAPIDDGLYEEFIQYCGKCGQKLDWGDES